MKPNRSKLFYVPQRPYMTLGTLRDQVIYPDTHQDQMRKRISDQDLADFLTKVSRVKTTTRQPSTCICMYRCPSSVVSGLAEQFSMSFHAFKIAQRELCPVLCMFALQLELSVHQRSLFSLQVQLSYLYEREGGWEATQDWMDVLSGGEKQRMAVSRRSLVGGCGLVFQSCLQSSKKCIKLCTVEFCIRKMCASFNSIRSTVHVCG